MVAILPDKCLGFGLRRIGIMPLQQPHAVPQIGHEWAQAGVFGTQPIVLLPQPFGFDGQN
jgi:hypothetical protein